jgi:ammonia channel protein AmtB
VGYSLAFGSGSSLVGLGDFVVGTGLAESALYSHWFFQFTFAATAATIVSGAVAERCSFPSYLTYSAVISGVIKKLKYEVQIKMLKSTFPRNNLSYRQPLGLV